MLGLLPGGVKFEPAKDIPDLSGKVVLVTGGNIGLGAESILQLSKHNPERIYLVARSRDKAEATIDRIKNEVPGAVILFLELDLGSFDSIKAAAEKFCSDSDRLDILINNAGIMACPPGLTSSGYEIQFGTNHMGHALFTKLLFPIMKRTAALPDADVRIVNLSSSGHLFTPTGGLVLDEAGTKMESHSTFRRYGQAKLANILFTYELARRFPSIRSIVVHPGAVNTNLGNGLRQFSSLWDFPDRFLKPFITVPVQRGVLNQLWAATSNNAESGKLYYPVGKENKGSQHSRDKELAQNLWEWTDKEFQRKGYTSTWD